MASSGHVGHARLAPERARGVPRADLEEGEVDYRLAVRDDHMVAGHGDDELRDGGARRRAVADDHRARGRGIRGVGGGLAHQEHDGMVGEGW